MWSVHEYWPTVDLRLVGPRSWRPDLAGEEANVTDCPALIKGVLKKLTIMVEWWNNTVKNVGAKKWRPSRMWIIMSFKISWEMNLRGVKLVGVAQTRFVQVPLFEWCLMRVVHIKLRGVNGIDNCHDVNYLGNSGKTQFKKWDLQTGTESSDAQNWWSGSRTY
jgi:hypothetical protein